jgi:hypothetical protein
MISAAVTTDTEARSIAVHLVTILRLLPVLILVRLNSLCYHVILSSQQMY